MTALPITPPFAAVFAVGMYRASGPVRGLGTVPAHLALVLVAVRLGADAWLRVAGYDTSSHG
ncbi:hypothetical protein [Methylobacterium marchantiae]|uniref:Uncharacterized protein n=1 Tax=Methylobacterium marchantiae TaxID=600331 RepID=A0ABW3X043_9HYPH|nr:hypothetical protein AIGOOFII_0015 [Methylobacterium marchantiae]